MALLQRRDVFPTQPDRLAFPGQDLPMTLLHRLDRERQRLGICGNQAAAQIAHIRTQITPEVTRPGVCEHDLHVGAGLGGRSLQRLVVIAACRGNQQGHHDATSCPTHVSTLSLLMKERTAGTLAVRPACLQSKCAARFPATGSRPCRSGSGTRSWPPAYSDPGCGNSRSSLSRCNTDAPESC